MTPMLYFDNNASTFIDPRVKDKMREVLSREQANPSSVHQLGQRVHRELLGARDEISSFLGVKAKEIIFTSNGTEALNMLIRGIIGSECSGHIVSSDLEHPAVYGTVKLLEEKGCTATYISPGKLGAVSSSMLQKAIRSDTKLIVLMAANNETGIISDIAALAKISK